MCELIYSFVIELFPLFISISLLCLLVKHNTLELLFSPSSAPLFPNMGEFGV